MSIDVPGCIGRAMGRRMSAALLLACNDCRLAASLEHGGAETDSLAASALPAKNVRKNMRE